MNKPTSEFGILVVVVVCFCSFHSLLEVSPPSPARSNKHHHEFLIFLFMIFKVARKYNKMQKPVFLL